MAVELYRHNKETYEKMIEMFKEGNRVGVVQPTGTGKSFLILKWIEDHPGEKIVMLSPSVEIFRQLRRYGEAMGISINAHACFFTYDKLNLMSKEEMLALRPDKIILDEFHRAGADQWGRSVSELLSLYPDAKVLGLTATPVRYLDHARNMADELFDGHLAREMTLGEAVESGILPVPLYIPAWYDVDGQMEKYQKGILKVKDLVKRRELEAELMTLKHQLEHSYGVKEIFEKYMPDGHGKYIVFCRNIEHLGEMKEILKGWLSGVNPNVHSYVSVSRQSDKDIQLRQFIEDMDETAVKLLFTVDRLNEGLHVEDIDGVIMLRPTESAIIFLQQMGRALSSKKAKTPIIFDLVSNYQNVRVDMGSGMSGNVFEKELYEAVKKKGAQHGDSIRFQIFEKAMTFSQMFERLNEALCLDREGLWNESFEAYKGYKEEFQVEPNSGAYYRGIYLGNWCSAQIARFRAGKLPLEREEALRSAGFCFPEQKGRGWDYRLEQWMAFRKEKGRNPRSEERYQGFALGSWQCQQITDYRQGRLSSEREEKLRSAGFCLTKSKQDTWRNHLRLYEEFKRTYRKEPCMDEFYKGIYLGRWCYEQKKKFRSGTLPPERTELLRRAGFCFEGKRKKRG